jgi:hypothetical protein
MRKKVNANKQLFQRTKNDEELKGGKQRTRKLRGITKLKSIRRSQIPGRSSVT